MFGKKISLARFRYADIHRKHGGPVAILSSRKSERLGEIVFEAFATLDQNVTGFGVDDSSLYGNSHGTGTAATVAEAVYRAISEALERWAWHETLEDKSRYDQFGYELDSTTTGFAAFPGLWPRATRSVAYFEALERWSLNAWWEGKLPHAFLREPLAWPGVSGVEILSPIPGGKVALLWKDTPAGRAYGFAAGISLSLASRKAAVELGRNIQVLEFAQTAVGSSVRLPKTQNERRLLFFSGESGRQAFERRLAQHVATTPRPPRLVVDCQVPGPWAKYTYVWRCLFDPTGFSDDGANDYFHF